MEAYLISILNQFGYLGVAFLIAIENVFPPIPSELILTFSGFMTTKSTMLPFLVVVAATIGSIIGAVILYFVGRILSEERMNAILDGRIGKTLRIKKTSVHKAILWFNNKGKYATLFGRCIPIIRSLISIPAGMSSMKFSTFFFYTTLGSVVWNSVLVYLGKGVGKNWHKVVDIFHTYSTLVILIIGIILIIALIYFIYKRKNTKKAS